jgi:adenylate kinase family enzyme
VALERVAVIGPVAAGKTTLSRGLSAALGLPWVDLDDVYFGDRSSPPPPWSDAAWAAHHLALVARPRWLISGDYRAVADDRFRRVDAVVWLDPPRWWCARRALRRGGAAPRRDVLRWIRRYRRHGRVETERTLAAHPTLPVLRYRAARNVTVDEVVADLANASFVR